MKKMKATLMCLFLASGNTLYSQSLEPIIVAPAGNYFEATGSDLSWTLGGNFILTLKTEEAILTQGFHQPIYLITSIEESLAVDYNLKVYPNPVIDEITISGILKSQEKVFIQLVDVEGKIVRNWTDKTLPFNVSGDEFPSGTYFISVLLEKDRSVFKTFKLVKI